MKTCELQIGDWVMVLPSKMYIKVAAVHKRKVAYHACTNQLEWVRQSLLRPIEITKKILIKNGFSSVIEGIYNDWEIETYSNQNLRISLSHVGSEYNPTQLVVYMDCQPEQFVFRTTDCKYVHKLQHAYFFLNINKKFEL